MTLDRSHVKALLRLADRLEAEAQKVRQLVTEQSGERTTTKPAVTLPEGLLEELRNADRGVAEKLLQGLTQKHLGEVFVELGGPGAGKKRSKDWLMERCLWYLFDFRAGHEIIRGTARQELLMEHDDLLAHKLAVETRLREFRNGDATLGQKIPGLIKCPSCRGRKTVREVPGGLPAGPCRVCAGTGYVLCD